MGLSQPRELGFLAQRPKPINMTWNQKEDNEDQMEKKNIWICSRTPITYEETHKCLFKNRQDQIEMKAQRHVNTLFKQKFEVESSW